MTSLVTATRAGFVVDSIEAAGFACRWDDGTGEWLVLEKDFIAPAVRAVFRDEWLGLCLDLFPATGRPLMDAMLLNSVLNGPARLVVTADATTRIRADVCITENDDALHERVKIAVADLLEGSNRFLNGTDTPQRDDDPPHVRDAFTPVVDALAEAGWEIDLDDLGCRVTIHAADRPQRASLRLDSRRGCLISAEMASLVDRQSVTGLASALLMLRTANGLRLVSPQMRSYNGQSTLLFTARFELARAAVDAVHALNAITLAVDACSEEVRALTANDELASLYLATQGIRSDAAQPCGAGLEQIVANQ